MNTVRMSFFLLLLALSATSRAVDLSSNPAYQRYLETKDEQKAKMIRDLGGSLPAPPSAAGGSALDLTKRNITGATSIGGGVEFLNPENANQVLAGKVAKGLVSSTGLIIEIGFNSNGTVYVRNSPRNSGFVHSIPVRKNLSLAGCTVRALMFETGCNFLSGGSRYEIGKPSISGVPVIYEAYQCLSLSTACTQVPKTITLPWDG